MRVADASGRSVACRDAVGLGVHCSRDAGHSAAVSGDVVHGELMEAGVAAGVSNRCARRVAPSKLRSGVMTGMCMSGWNSAPWRERSKSESSNCCERYLVARAARAQRAQRARLTLSLGGSVVAGVAWRVVSVRVRRVRWVGVSSWASAPSCGSPTSWCAAGMWNSRSLRTTTAPTGSVVRRTVSCRSTGGGAVPARARATSGAPSRSVRPTSISTRAQRARHTHAHGS